MKIAIIEDDKEHLKILKDELMNTAEIDFFSNTIDFGKANLKSYDMIVVDNTLDTMSGKDLIRSISTKTNAQFFLMNETNEQYSEDIIDDEHIAGFILKNDIKSFKEHIKYVNVKLRLSKSLEQDTHKYQEILNKDSSYKIEEYKDYISIVLSNPIESKENLKKDIEKIGKYNALVSFGTTHTSSLLLRDLIVLYSFFRDKKGKMIFWNSSNTMSEVLDLCNLNQILLIVSKKEDALNIFNKN
jgi:anti-anti-sigma regulatory factor